MSEAVDPVQLSEELGPEGAAEDELFFGMSAARLRSRARWTSIFLILSSCLPYEFVDTHALFLWDIIAELPLASQLAAVAMSLAGLAILIASFVAKRATSLAVTVAASFALVAIFYQLGGDRAAWEVFSMPASVTNRPALILLALILTGTGARLAFRPRARPLAKYVLIASTVSAVVFYAWPTRAEAPLSTIYRAFASLPDLPDFRFQIGMVMIVGIVVWPLFVSLLGLLYLRKPPEKAESWLSILATFGFPGLLLMFVFRAAVFANAGLALFAYLLAVLMITAILAVGTAALVVLGEALTLSPDAQVTALEKAPASETTGKRKRSPGLPIQTAATAAGVVIVLLSATEWFLARPPKKGVNWTLETTSESGDKVFGRLFLDWQQNQEYWQSKVREKASASERIELKKTAHDLEEMAKTMDKGLAESFHQLTSESEDLDLAGRHFYHLVSEVNESSRKAHLPYYIDPAVILFEQKDGGITRSFHAYPYKIEAVNRYDVGGDEFATLYVRAIGYLHDGHSRLGFSRDMQPFALVVLDEVDRVSEQMELSAQHSVCAGVTPTSASFDSYKTCGKLISKLMADAQGRAKEEILAGTERHELQHQIDGPDLPLAQVVLRRLSPYVPSFQDRVNRELSAYMAEMTADGLAPRFGLVNLAEFVISEHAGPYHHTGVMVFEALSDKELRHGIEPSGEVYYDRFEKTFEELMEMPTDQLREKARVAYKRLFRVELATTKRR